MISKKYICEKVSENSAPIWNNYFKCYYIFKILIYKKQIGFDEYLFKGDKYVD